MYITSVNCAPRTPQRSTVAGPDGGGPGPKRPFRPFSGGFFVFSGRFGVPRHPEGRGFHFPRYRPERWRGDPVRGRNRVFRGFRAGHWCLVETQEASGSLAEASGGPGPMGPMGPPGPPQPSPRRLHVSRQIPDRNSDPGQAWARPDRARARPDRAQARPDRARARPDRARARPDRAQARPVPGPYHAQIDRPAVLEPLEGALGPRTAQEGKRDTKGP